MQASALQGACQLFAHPRLCTPKPCLKFMPTDSYRYWHAVQTHQTSPCPEVKRPMFRQAGRVSTRTMWLQQRCGCSVDSRLGELSALACWGEGAFSSARHACPPLEAAQKLVAVQSHGWGAGQRVEPGQGFNDTTEVEVARAPCLQHRARCPAASRSVFGGGFQGRAARETATARLKTKCCRSAASTGANFGIHDWERPRVRVDTRLLP